MIELPSALLHAAAQWCGQVLALKLGSSSSCVCPPCPAHSFSCQCHGDPPTARPATELAVAVVLLLLLGIVVGFLLGGLTVWLALLRRTQDRAETDEREAVQLELRRLRKGQ